jgi:hypothetical protein
MGGKCPARLKLAHFCNIFMPYALRQWPATVYPGDIAEFPEARAAIDVALNEMRRQGPSPAGYQVKNLGKAKHFLWQLNLKVANRQLRILYAPYKNLIVVFRIHKKSSPQEQQREYTTAMNRKKQAERVLQSGGVTHDLTIH